MAAKGEQLHAMSLELRQAQEEAADKAKAAEEAVAALKAGQVRAGYQGCCACCWVLQTGPAAGSGAAFLRPSFKPG